ncbi:MAG: SDR family oxidoreductase [Bacteroidota bacterium]
MRILLTGVNGLLGQHLLSLLSSKSSYEVYATGMGVNRNLPGDYHYYPCDLTKNEKVKDLVNKVKPDYIIHSAAKTQVDWCELNKKDCWESNVSATEYLLSASMRYAGHFQYISTDFVFDGKQGNYLETDPPNPVNYYGESKLAAEKLVMASGIPWSIARTVLVYGIAHQMSRSNILVWIYNSLKNNQKIRVVTDQVRTPTFVEDLAMGSSLILDKHAEGIYHISGDEIMTPYELAIKVAEFFDFNKELIEPVDGSIFSQEGKRPERTGFRIAKARKTLDFSPKNIEENFVLVADKLKNNSA